MNRIKRLFSSCEFSFFLASPAFVWQALFALLPLLFIFFISFFDVSHGIRAITFSLQYYKTSLNIIHGKIIFSSFLLSLLTTMSCLIAGYPIAYYIALRAKRYKNLLLFFIVLPLWINFLVLVYSWIFVLEKNGILNQFLMQLSIISEPLDLLNSRFAVGLAMFYCYLPFMIMPIFSILEKFDTQLLEASSDLGARPSQTFFKIIVPLSMPGIRTGCFLVFVPVFGEYVVPLLMGGDKYMFVGNAISHYVFTVLDLSQGAAFTIVSITVLLLAVGIINMLLRKFFVTR